MSKPEANGKNENAFDNIAFEGDDEKGLKNDNELEFTKTSFGPIDAEAESSEPKVYKIRILKNILVICLSFTFVFTSYTSMGTLQSSINPDLGPYSLAVLYGALVLSCCFVPTWLIKKLTVKWTLCLCQLGYSLYIAAQFWPEYYTLMPAAVIVGFCAAPMWSAKCTYLTHVGHAYAKQVKDNTEVIIVRFFGIFFLFFQAASVWGQLISSAVLNSDDDDDVEISDEDLAMCGIDFCPSDSSGNNTNLDPPSKSKIYTLATVYLVCSMIGALIVALLLDPLSRTGGTGDRGGDQGTTGKRLLIATFKQWRHPYQLLIIPLTMWSGLEQGYIQNDYTRAFISCAYGTGHIGYVLVCLFAVDAIFSISFGPIVRYAGRIIVFTIGAAANVAGFVLLYRWSPTPDEAHMFYIIAAIWGLGDAVWQTQINAFYGVIFKGKEEAAFSNYRLWESMGFIISYVLQMKACTLPHASVAASFLGLGMIGYYIIELLQWRCPQTYRGQEEQETCDQTSISDTGSSGGERSLGDKGTPDGKRSISERRSSSDRGSMSDLGSLSDRGSMRS